MRDPVLWLLLLALLVPGVARAGGPCGVEAGEVIAEEGVGGTGREGDAAAREQGGEDGLGGTGRSEGGDGLGGTGLFGTLTSFAPLCVNGQAIALDAETRLFAEGDPVSADRLRVGQVLWVVGQIDEGVLRAERVDLLWAARGAIAAVEARRRRVQVGTSWVTLLDHALVVDQSTGLHLDPRGLRVGELVAISALRDGEGKLFASRIDRIAATRGNGTVVRPAHLPEVDALARESHVAALRVEGFLGTDAAGGLTLGSLPLETSSFDPTARSALTAESRVWVQGALAGGALRASRVVLPPPAVRAPTPQPMPNLPGLPRPGLVRPTAPPNAPRSEGPRDRSVPPPPPAPPPPRGIEPGEGPTRIEPDITPVPVPRTPTRLR